MTTRKPTLKEVRELQNTIFSKNHDLAIVTAKANKLEEENKKLARERERMYGEIDAYRQIFARIFPGHSNNDY